jgi:hypothetical protein
MKVTVNLWHLEKRNQTLEGEISVAEMDMESFDELVQLPHPAALSIGSGEAR